VCLLSCHDSSKSVSITAAACVSGPWFLCLFDVNPLHFSGLLGTFNGALFVLVICSLLLLGLSSLSVLTFVLLTQGLGLEFVPVATDIRESS
jgi:ABC-type cobalamin transport system permease subunit